MEYKIEIKLIPSKPEAPWHWAIRSTCYTGWQTEATGNQVTFNKAWNEAIVFYNKNIKGRTKDV